MSLRMGFAIMQKGEPMSVLIKDMEMPKCCDECPIYSRSATGCILASYGCVDRYNYDISVRPEWCPLIEQEDE